MIRPILFNTDMVQSILDGRKTVTRRVVKPPYYVDEKYLENNEGIIEHTLRSAPKSSRLYQEIGEMPYPENFYEFGDILYVRESVFQGIASSLQPSGETESYFTHDFEYYADGLYKKGHWKDEYQHIWMARRPSIHMPKEATRIWLKVTDVRVKRLQDMWASDVSKEGLLFTMPYTADEMLKKFSRLWDSTIKKVDRGLYGWIANPWVWVIEFERCEKPEGWCV